MAGRRNKISNGKVRKGDRGAKVCVETCHCILKGVTLLWNTTACSAGQNQFRAQVTQCS